MSHRPWIVLKYGGTSVASTDRWERIAARIRELAPEHGVWLVVSALAGTTDRLQSAIRAAESGHASDDVEHIVAQHEELARDAGLGREVVAELEPLFAELSRLLEGVRLTGEASPRLVARIMATGELASSRLGAALLATHGLEARWVDARDLIDSTARPDDTDATRYLAARVPTRSDPERARNVVDDAGLVITQGFIARTPEGETCLLGRGGSDTSAALFAALLEADRCEIWTDVHGMFTADPTNVPGARLIRRIGYREAQELAAMGAKVLHPRSLRPVAESQIPLEVRSVDAPGSAGTVVRAVDEDSPEVTAVTCRTGVTLLSLSTLAMWERPGFLAQAFRPFDELGMSIDLVATSESEVSLTLDAIPGGLEGREFAALLARLEALADVTVVHPCAVVSVVGRRIRGILNQIGPAMEEFQERSVHLLSSSSEDLNFSFVVDEAEGAPMVVRLHRRLFAAQADHPRLGPTWEALQRGEETPTHRPAWWQGREAELEKIVADGRARYVYDLPTIETQARRLREEVGQVDRFYYSMKANPHPEILQAVARCGFGIECVSAAEIGRAREVLGDEVPLLFTPNFCPLDEYAAALAAGAEVTIDGPAPLEQRPDLFADGEVAVRVDPGRGFGHSQAVRTAGTESKFGHPFDELPRVAEAAERHGVRIIGLHAHVGSGNTDPRMWLEVGTALAEALEQFPDVRWLDLGGGLGVVERPGQQALDLERLDAYLGSLRQAMRPVEIRLEPGRYLVSEAGVLLAPVTQVRSKGTVRFAGVATGMNSLVRPALYAAWHAIHNISRLGEPASQYWQVVGPICESGDVLGRERWMPDPRPGDVLLIANAGAYGAAMSSHYNLRAPATEVVLR